MKLDLQDTMAAGGLLAITAGLWIADPALALMALGILLYLGGTGRG